MTDEQFKKLMDKLEELKTDMRRDRDGHMVPCYPRPLAPADWFGPTPDWTKIQITD